MAIEKKFYQVRLAESCKVPTKMVNGISLTKKWQVKVGEIGDLAQVPDVEAQVVVKQGSGFVPVKGIHVEAPEGTDGGSGSPSGPASTPAKDAEEAKMSADTESELSDYPEFGSMTVEQLKAYLIAKGVAQNELKNIPKPELIERAEFIWSQK